MSRYIDVKWLEENAKEYSLGYYEDDEWATPLNVLDTAPSIDIVFCKECKKCYKDTDALTKQTVLICQKHKYEFDWEKVEADDFCSYGEREGE